jgi:hypothetical protein
VQQMLKANGQGLGVTKVKVMPWFFHNNAFLIELDVMTTFK